MLPNFIEVSCDAMQGFFAWLHANTDPEIEEYARNWARRNPGPVACVIERRYRGEVLTNGSAEIYAAWVASHIPAHLLKTQHERALAFVEQDPDHPLAQAVAEVLAASGVPE